MEGGSFTLRSPLPWRNPKPSARKSSFRRVIRASYDLQGSYRGPKLRRDWIAELVSNNDDAVRSLPIYDGGGLLLAVLVNRAFSGVAPSLMPADDSSLFSNCFTIAGRFVDIRLGSYAYSGRSSVAVDQTKDYICVSGQTNGDVPKWPIGQTIWDRGSIKFMCIIYALAESYLADLSIPWEAVILQPLEGEGIAILGEDTVRGFTTSDQAWITLVAEKIDASRRKSCEQLHFDLGSTQMVIGSIVSFLYISADRAILL